MKAAVSCRANQPQTVAALELLETQRNEVTVPVAAASYSSETAFVDRYDTGQLS